MSAFVLRVMLAATVTAGLAACVPTTTTTSPSTAAPVALPQEGLYLATSDNGIAIPAIDTSKVPAQFQRQIVDYPSTEAPGTVIINPATKHLYFITGNNKAIRYGISVGAAGFEWSGEALVTNRRQWPTWTPPKEMIERKPELAKWEKGQPGGPTNPLGARALYLTTNGVDYGYRIHGTPDWWSIGKNASSGCIRMINQDVMDLYTRVPDNAKVIVLTARGEMPKGLKLPPPAPKKKKPEPAPAVATPATTPEATPATATAPVVGPVTGPMSTAPLPLPSATPTPAAGALAPARTTPTAPALDTPPTTPAVTAPVAPAQPSLPTAPTTPAPAAVTAPSVSAPSVSAPSAAVPTAPAPAPAATPAAPGCAVPLVNGTCPKP